MKKLGFFLLCIAVLSSSKTQAQETLQYNLTKGQSFKIAQKGVQDFVQIIDSVESKATNTISGVTTWTVEQVLEDKYIIRSSFESIRLKTESEIYGVLFDINTDASVDSLDMQSEVFRGLIDIPFTVVLLKTGEVEAVKDSGAMIENMIVQSGIEDENVKQKIRESMDGQFGDAGLASSIEQMTFLFPTEKVKVGDTWENDYVGDLEAHNIWSLDSYNENEYVINGKASVIMKMDDSTGRMTLEGTQTTQATIDRASGLFNDVTVHQYVEGVSLIPDFGNQDMPTKLTATITYKRL